MKYLAIAPGGAMVAGRRIRSVRFEDRSSLPASAACVVASGARETLGALFGTAVALRLCEPMLPSPDGWAEIVRDATLFRYRGTVADAAIVLRPRDARALARAAFGELSGDDPLPGGPLSPLEWDVLARVAAAIGASLPAVCGVREGSSVERVAEIGGFTTFFELLLERPVAAGIGIAVSRDPAPEPRGALALEDLGDIPLPVEVALDAGTYPASVVTGLAPGSLLALAPGLRGRLRCGGRTLAFGPCGVRHGWYALVVEEKA